MKPNKPQLITLIISIPLLIFLFVYRNMHPDAIHSAHLVLLVIIVIIIFFGLRTKPEINNDIIWKQKSLQLLEKGDCPFCEKNQVGEYKIRIGYSKRRFDFKYYVFWIEYKYWKDELVSSSPICDSCKDRFLRNHLPEPSITVLEMKPGYSRGLSRPYERGHIFKPEPIDFYSNL